MSDKTAVRYIATVGINYQRQPGPGEGRAEIGDEVPAYAVARSPHLLERGYVVAEAVTAPESDGA